MGKEINKNSTLTELEMFELEKKIRDEEKLRRKAVTDQVLRFLGLILATMIFLISFSMTVGLTIFSRLFGLRAREVWRDGLSFVFEPGSIYYALIGPDTTVAIILMTFIQIALATALAFLVSYYIRDLIGILKNILKLGKSLTDELATNLKEGAQDLGLGSTKKKSLFEDESSEVKQEEVKTSKRGRKSKEEVEKEKARKLLQQMGVPVEQKVEVSVKDPLDLLSAEQQDLVLQGKAKIEDFLPSQPIIEEKSKKLFE
jgi:hypothetical protein